MHRTEEIRSLSGTSVEQNKQHADKLVKPHYLLDVKPTGFYMLNVHFNAFIIDIRCRRCSLNCPEACNGPFSARHAAWEYMYLMFFINKL